VGNRSQGHYVAPPKEPVVPSGPAAEGRP
jgi:hypothetical protein